MSIRLKGFRREDVEVTVSFRDLVEGVCAELRQRYKIPGDARLSPEGWMVCDERDWRHGSVGTDILSKEPTPDQVAGLKMLKELEDLARRFAREDEEKGVRP